jgi:hypothetical protein
VAKTDDRVRVLSPLAVCVLTLVALAVIPLRAADTSFVGVLALAVEKDVAAQLELTEQTKRKLLDLIDQRESQALDIVQENRDLPPAEQAARLMPFVADSERLGFALLTMEQRAKLQRIRVARSGMLSLGEAGLASSLGLTEQQQQSVHELLQQRAVDLTRGGETEQRITRAIYERKLASLLTEPQRAAWEKMAGLSDAAIESTAAEPAMTVPATEQPAEAEPTVSVPSATEPSATEPAATEPAATEPAATEPAATEPAATEPSATEPAATEPAATEPAATEPAATEPAATEPAATEPALTEPAAIVPTTTVPATAAPAASVPATTVPAATAPAATVPATPAPSTPETTPSGR